MLMLNMKCQGETDKIEYDRIRRNASKLINQSKDILLAISNRKTYKTPGPDKVSPRLLKE